jgi:SAM-dependent methyltransferase
VPYSNWIGRQVPDVTERTFLRYAAHSIGRKVLTNLRRRGTLRSMDRTVERLQQQYDEARSKIEIGSFEEFVFGNSPDDFALIDGRVEFTSPSRAARANLALLHQLVARYPGAGKVVEFGSGTGRNLLYLASQGVPNPLVGLELSSRSTALAERAAQRFGLKVRYELCDVSQRLPDLGLVDVVFSVHAFEMMPRIFCAGLENIARLQPRAAIFFEPIEELWPWSPLGMVARVRIRQLDRLRGFGRVARKLGRVAGMGMLAHAANAVNQTCFMIVEMRS